jgi:electron transfer flavoprotein alpha/beta subunit
MEAMKSAKIEELAVDEVSVENELAVSSMALPESGTHAEMIEGNVQQVAQNLAVLLKEGGVLA